MVNLHLWHFVYDVSASTLRLTIIKCVAECSSDAPVRMLNEGTRPFVEDCCWPSHTVSWTAT